MVFVQTILPRWLLFSHEMNTNYVSIKVYIAVCRVTGVRIAYCLQCCVCGVFGGERATGQQIHMLRRTKPDTRYEPRLVLKTRLFVTLVNVNKADVSISHIEGYVFMEMYYRRSIAIRPWLRTDARLTMSVVHQCCVLMSNALRKLAGWIRRPRKCGETYFAIDEPIARCRCHLNRVC